MHEFSNQLGHTKLRDMYLKVSMQREESLLDKWIHHIIANNELQTCDLEHRNYVNNQLESKRLRFFHIREVISERWHRL